MLRAQPDAALSCRITQVRPLPGVRAGSALLEYRGRLLAIQDDAWSAAWIDPRTGALEPWVFEGDGGSLPKKLKPDFEAVLREGDRAWVLASGSTVNRVQIVRLDLATGHGQVQDAEQLYDALESALGRRPNLEGIVAGGDSLRVFHRGAIGRRSAIVTLTRRALEGGGRVEQVQWCELGDIDGVPLHFTDAVGLPDGRVAYLAAAENTNDPVADGDVAGAALGVIDGDDARWTPVMEGDGARSRRKVEGLVLDSGGGWLVTDADDALQSAELCRYEAVGFG